MTTTSDGRMPTICVECTALFGETVTYETVTDYPRHMRAVLPGIKITQPLGPDGKQHRAYNGIRLRGPQDPDPDPDHNGETRVSSRLSTPDPPHKRDEARVNPLWSQSSEGGPCVLCHGPTSRRQNGQWVHATPAECQAHRKKARA